MQPINYVHLPWLGSASCQSYFHNKIEFGSFICNLGIVVIIALSVIVRNFNLRAKKARDVFLEVELLFFSFKQLFYIPCKVQTIEAKMEIREGISIF